MVNNAVDAKRLKSFIERIERLEEEKKALSEDIKEVYNELKAVGYDAKIVRKVIKIMKMDSDSRQEEAYLTDVYLNALQPDLVKGGENE